MNFISENWKEIVKGEYPKVDLTSTMKLEFYPNSCSICQATEKLKRCSRCNMISYCGKKHQIQHWPHHKELCNVILGINKEQEISHLYQNFQGQDSQSWRLQLELLAIEVEKRLSRDLNIFEMKVLMFPRVCYVCYEARQELLRNCPDCPAASFCQNHLKSSLHNQDCQKIKEIHEIVKDISWENQKFLLQNLLSMLTSIQIEELSKLPLSTEEFFRQFVSSEMHLSKNERIFLSNILNVQLTTFNVLKIINYSDSDLIIYIEDVPSSIKEVDNISPYWEVLLHLLPHLRSIKIVFLNEVSRCEMDIKLCKKCNLSNKKIVLESNTITYFEYMEMRNYMKPNILLFLNVQPEDLDDELISWQIKIMKCREINCPLVFTSYRETEPIKFREVVKSTFGNSQVHYDGINKFRTLLPFRKLDGGICLLNHFLIVIDPPKSQKPSLKSFYATFCAFCHFNQACIPCENCKMIFYCKKSHQKKHISQHQDICGVVSKMLGKTEDSNLFDKLKKTDRESWLNAKIDLMLKVKTKLGRDLSDFEKEMFLFPKTCLICHESDWSLLKNCKCGITLCEIHKDDPKHKQLCIEFALAFEFSKISVPPCLEGQIVAKEGMDIKEYNSIDDFFDSFYKFNEEGTLQNSLSVQKIIFADLHSRPLTLVYALKKLGFMVDYKMVIHVIGATGMEMGTYAYWMPVFFLLDRLEVLKIIFIGPEVFNDDVDEDYLDIFFNDSNGAIIDNTRLNVECHALTYDEYFKSDSFVKPNLIVGFNLNLHESELGITECTWKETIFALRNLKVPFVLTAGTEDRARKDHKWLCELLGNSIDYFCLEQNLFPGLIPKRDFESDDILYSNQYVIIYERLCKKEDENTAEKSPNLENSDL